MPGNCQKPWFYDDAVRTTLQIDDDVLAAARSIAEAEEASLGTVISRLARRGLNPTVLLTGIDLPAFSVAAAASPITPAMVRRAIEEGPDSAM
jgi:hypothetical protein